MTALLQSSGEFVTNFVPPSYLIEGFLLRCYLYALTAPTGHGKTSVALYIALTVALGREVCGHEVEKCRVVYFAGENDSDIRMRWIKLCEENGVDPDEIEVFFMPTIERLSDKKFQHRLLTEVEAIGPVGLMFVDTSAAYSEMEEENANMQILDHAKALRSFIKLLPGNPTVIVLCHPTKTPNMENLLPRGGGAFLAEIDGNLVCKLVPGTWVVDLDTHGKFRGADFEPMSFQLVSGTSDKLKDAKGRYIPTVTARPLSDFDRSEITDWNRSEQDKVLLVLLDNRGLSVADIAKKAGFVTRMGGEPQKSKTWRLLKALKGKNLVDKDRAENYSLTDKGQKEAKTLKTQMAEKGRSSETADGDTL
jgi:AAA domain-containing protein